MKAAADLADAAGRVLNYTCLSDLQRAMSKLNIKLVLYDQEVEKAKCDFCAMPCLQLHCPTNKERERNEKDEKS